MALQCQCVYKTGTGERIASDDEYFTHGWLPLLLCCWPVDIEPLHQHMPHNQLQVFRDLHVINSKMNGHVGQLLAAATAGAGQGDPRQAQLLRGLLMVLSYWFFLQALTGVGAGSAGR